MMNGLSASFIFIIKFFQCFLGSSRAFSIALDSQIESNVNFCQIHLLLLCPCTLHAEYVVGEFLVIIENIH